MAFVRGKNVSIELTRVDREACLDIAVGREVGGISAGERALLIMKGGIRILLVVGVMRSLSICPGVMVWAYGLWQTGLRGYGPTLGRVPLLFQRLLSRFD